MTDVPAWSDEPIETHSLGPSWGGDLAVVSRRWAARQEQLRRADMVARSLTGRGPKDGWSETYLDNLITRLAPFIPGLRYKESWFVISKPLTDFSLVSTKSKAGRKVTWTPIRELELLDLVAGLMSDPGRNVHTDTEALKVVRRLYPALCRSGDRVAGDTALKGHLANARKRLGALSVEHAAMAQEFLGANHPDWPALSARQRDALTTVALTQWLGRATDVALEDFLASLK